MSVWVVFNADKLSAQENINKYISALDFNRSCNTFVLLLGYSLEETTKLRHSLSKLILEKQIYAVTAHDFNIMNSIGKQWVPLCLDRWFRKHQAEQLLIDDQRQLSPSQFLLERFKFIRNETEEHNVKEGEEKTQKATQPRQHLAFISPLPPEQTGIANYNQKLLPILGEHYDITLVIQQANLADSIKTIPGIVNVLTADEFRQKAEHFDRLVYHIGNSLYHAWQFSLLKEHPGLVVLHDYYLFDAIWWQESAGILPHAVKQSLYTQHGYAALIDAETKTQGRGPDHYPVNADIINEAAGLVVHSKHAKQLHQHWYPNHPDTDIHTLPLYRDIPDSHYDPNEAKTRANLSKHTLVITSFGGINEKKGTDSIVKAFLDCRFPPSIDVKLVLVGAENTSPFGTALKKHINSHPNGKKILITGYTNDSQYSTWMQATDIAIQLRKDSRGESSGTLFDVMVHGKCAIVNAHGSSAEVPANCVWQLTEEISIEELKEAMLALTINPEQRIQLGKQAYQWICETLCKDTLISRYKYAIEKSINHPIRKEYQWLNELASQIQSSKLNDKELSILTKQLAPLNLLEQRSAPRILFDISTLAWKDQKTGIERVTRELAIQLLSHPPKGYAVELIQWRGETYYTHPDYAAALLGISDEGLTSRPAEAVTGDLYLSVEWSPPILEQAKNEMLKMRARGVRFYFAVHDLLPIIMPQYFPEGTDQSMHHWFNNVTDIADGLLCVSNCVAKDVSAQIQKIDPSKQPFIGVFNSGANFSKKTTPLSVSDEQCLQNITTSAATKLLMVGTIEPRKGHQQVLDGFDILWQQNSDTALIIVGKQGWDVDKLIHQIEKHPQLNKRLFWLKECSDALLQALYKNSDGLIAASYGEGFGLPLIEAAQNQLPLLVRDIPIFREVAQQYAEFFKAETANEMTNALTLFTQKCQTGELRERPALRYNDWHQSAKQLIEQIFSDTGLHKYSLQIDGKP